MYFWYQTDYTLVKLGGFAPRSYNPGMESQSRLPDADRLSILAATILLNYALARFIEIPARSLELQLPGFYFVAELNFQTVAAILSMGITVAGADWLLRTHPSLHAQPAFEHWLLPALTAWIIGIPLFQLPIGPIWWAGFALGGGFLLLVLVAEYIAVDPTDARLPLAAATLTATAYAIFLTMGISLRFAGTRLFLLLPAILVATGLVVLRTLNLRLHGRWMWFDAILIALVCVQLSAGLHYLPLAPVPFGLLVLAPAYSLTILFANLREGLLTRQAIVEPLVVFVLICITAIWLT